MTGAGKKQLDLLLKARINHRLWPLPVWAGKTWRCAKQPADQRTLGVHLAPLLAEVRTTQTGQRRLMLFAGLDREPCHLFAGGGHRPAAIMTSWLAFKRRNTVPEKPDLLTDSRHVEYLP